MKFINFIGLLLLSAAFLNLTSCSDDDSDDPNTENSQENETDETDEDAVSDSISSYALWVITDTDDFSGLLMTTEDIPEGEVDPTTESYSLLGAARSAGISYGNAIYNPSNTSGDVGIQKFAYENNALSDEGFISVGESRFTFEVVSDTKGYYTDSERSRTAIQTFNPETMARTGEIDITDSINKYLTDDVSYTRLGSFMIENEGYLYTQVFYFNESGLHAFDSTFVAVFNVETDELVNVAIHPDYIWLGFERKNPNFIGKAENGDLYLASLVGNSTDQAHSRCLRILAGETQFDSSWKLDYNDIIGEEGSYSLGGPAVLDGKLYIRMKASGMATDYSNYTDEDLYAYEVDIDTQEATKIEDIPASSASSTYSVSGPVVMDDKVYFVVSNSEYQGYYAYDPTTGTSEEAFSFSGGIPSQFIEINE